HTPTPAPYTLSLHDALPIYRSASSRPSRTSTTSSTRPRLDRSFAFGAPDTARPPVATAPPGACPEATSGRAGGTRRTRRHVRPRDRKSTRLNSSHDQTSYAV